MNIISLFKKNKVIVTVILLLGLFYLVFSFRKKFIKEGFQECEGKAKELSDEFNKESKVYTQFRSSFSEENFKKGKMIKKLVNNLENHIFKEGVVLKKEQSGYDYDIYKEGDNTVLFIFRCFPDKHYHCSKESDLYGKIQNKNIPFNCPSDKAFYMIELYLDPKVFGGEGSNRINDLKDKYLIKEGDEPKFKKTSLSLKVFPFYYKTYEIKAKCDLPLLIKDINIIAINSINLKDTSEQDLKITESFTNYKENFENKCVDKKMPISGAYNIKPENDVWVHDLTSDKPLTCKEYSDKYCVNNKLSLDAPPSVHSLNADDACCACGGGEIFNSSIIMGINNNFTTKMNNTTSSNINKETGINTFNKSDKLDFKGLTCSDEGQKLVNMFMSESKIINLFKYKYDEEMFKDDKMIKKFIKNLQDHIFNDGVILRFEKDYNNDKFPDSNNKIIVINYIIYIENDDTYIANLRIIPNKEVNKTVYLFEFLLDITWKPNDKRTRIDKIQNRYKDKGKYFSVKELSYNIYGDHSLPGYENTGQDSIEYCYFPKLLKDMQQILMNSIDNKDTLREDLIKEEDISESFKNYVKEDFKDSCKDLKMDVFGVYDVRAYNEKLQNHFVNKGWVDNWNANKPLTCNEYSDKYCVNNKISLNAPASFHDLSAEKACCACGGGDNPIHIEEEEEEEKEKDEEHEEKEEKTDSEHKESVKNKYLLGEFVFDMEQRLWDRNYSNSLINELSTILVINKNNIKLLSISSGSTKVMFQIMVLEDKILESKKKLKNINSLLSNTFSYVYLEENSLKEFNIQPTNKEIEKYMDTQQKQQKQQNKTQNKTPSHVQNEMLDRIMNRIDNIGELGDIKVNRSIRQSGIRGVGNVFSPRIKHYENCD